MSQGVRTRDGEMCLKAITKMSHIIFKKNHNLKFPTLKKNQHFFHFKELNLELLYRTVYDAFEKTLVNILMDNKFLNSRVRFDY